MLKRAFKQTYRTLRRPFEWALIYLALAVIPRLSHSGMVKLANRMSNLLFYLCKRDRKIAYANLFLMFGKRMTPRRARIIIHHSFQHMILVLLNIFWLTRDTRNRVLEQVELSDEIFQVLKQEAPVILISAHLGNWEVLTQALVAHGIDVMSVAKQVGTVGMTNMLIKVRSSIGQKIVPAEGALRPLLGALKKGISIGLLVDQQVHTWDGGTWVDFFGVPLGVSMAPSALARRNKVPIFFGWSRPLKNGCYRIEYDTRFDAGDYLSDQELTAAISAAFERVIRRHPSFWCLNYRYWRYIKPGSDPAIYPFYARPLKPAAGHR